MTCHSDKEKQYVTSHGKQRIKERVQPKNRSPESLCKLVFSQGIPIEKTSGDMYKWIDRRRRKYKDTLALLYKEHLYIYSNTYPHPLITTFRVPKGLRSNARRLDRKKRRNCL